MNRSLFLGGVLALGTLVSACGGLSSHGQCGSPGGGVGGGSAGGGSAIGGGSATGGGSAGGGSATGGGAATGGGSATGGGAGGGGGTSSKAFTYSELAMPAASSGYVTAIAGRPGEVWAVTDFGHVMKKLDDGGFTDIPGSWNGELYDVWVGPNGEVMMISGRNSFSCSGPCNTFADFTQLSVGDSSWGLNSICGNAFNDIYAIGNRDTAAVATLAHFDGTTWSTQSQDLGMTDPHGCFMRPDGTMWIAGLKDIVKWEQGAATLETLDLDLTALGSSASSQYWYDVAGFGDDMFAVGTDHRVIGRDANGHWTLVSNPAQQQSDFYAIGAVSPTELYAGGYDYSGETMWWHSDGGTWAPSNPDLPFINYVKAVYVAGPNEMYIGGDDGNFGPMILRATR
jgi:hypothetical protein